MTLQEVLTEKSDELYKATEAETEAIEQHQEWKTEADEHTVFRAQFHLEVALFYSNFYFVEKAEKHVNAAAAAAGIRLSETGALGKRTKFQVKDLAQFTIDVTKIDEEMDRDDADNETENDLPKDLKLDDEVRMDKIKFVDSKRGSTTSSLGPTGQAVVLAAFTLKQRSQPNDALTNEELTPYLATILDTNRPCWAIKTSALLFRSKLEGKASRTVERSLMQVETLVDSIKAEQRNRRRLRSMYTSRLPPYWRVESELCNLYLSMGSTRSALDIALRLHQWVDVIACYHQLQLRHKAAEVIRKQLEKKETPLLYCMLGDATDELDHYSKALEMTNGRSARAHKSLGYFHYYRKDYKTAVEHMKKSIDISSFQLQVMLRLGYAAMEIEDWDTAAMAYRKYCVYESDVSYSNWF
jgi:hypothetical protein